MSIHRGPKITNNGLVVYLDAASNKSYPGSGTTWFDRSGASEVSQNFTATRTRFGL